jgi:hypothetical protein
MRQTRRQFVGTALGAIAATGVALPAAAAPGPVRVSLERFAPDKLASLRKGVAAMKALPPSDHRSWFWQAATHAYNGALYAEALARDPKVADGKPYWNQCPHFGQCSADFLIWHRAFLFYFERTLRDVAQDADLALPYWDYSTAAGRSFPAAYMPEFLDHARSIANPLFHPTRNYDFTTGETLLSDPVATAPGTLSAPTFFSDIGVPGFGGDSGDKGHPRQSLIETRPHGDIHMVVGGYITGINANGAMSDIPTAAFDPVFWAHHANIDRLWTVWAASPGKSWGPMPADSWLDETPFTFKDFDGSDASQSRRFYMDRRNLAVRYDCDGKPELALPKVSEIVMATAGGGGNRHARRGQQAPPEAAMVMDAMMQQIEIAADNTPIDATPGAPVSREIGGEPRLRVAAPPGQGMVGATAPPPPPVAAEAPGSDAAVLAAPPKATRIVLELSGISFTHAPSSGFAVYLATPEHSAGAFVGLLDLFGATHPHVAGMGAMEALQSFDVTAIVRGRGGPFTVRIAPYDLLVTKSGASAARRADGVRIARVRFLALG